MRTNLQEWKNRLYRATWDQFGYQLQYCMDNFETNKQIFGLLQETVLKYQYDEESLEKIVDQRKHDRLEITFDNSTHQASFCYQSLKYFIKTCNSYHLHRYTIFGGSDFEDKKRVL